MKKIFLLGVLLFANVVPAWAATRYASPTGSGSACTVLGTPCTLNTAISQLVAGDTLHLLNGTYAQTLTNPLPSGTSGSPTIMVGESRSAILQPASGSGNAILLNSARDYITFRGFTIDAVNLRTGETGGIRHSNTIAMTGLVIEDMDIKSMQGPGIVIGTTANGCTIRRNSIHDSVGSATQSATGLYMRAAGCTIEHNAFYDLNSNGLVLRDDLGVGTGHIVRYNSFTNCSVLNFETDDACIFVNSKNNVIHNNRIHSTERAGIYLFSADTNLIFNNTVYGSSGYGIRIANTLSDNNQITNNIVSTNTVANISDNGTGTTQTTNSTSAACMIDAANGDFNLVELSACIDAGTVVAATGLWGGHSGRYVGAGVDQGAFEAPIRLSAAAEDATPTIYSVTYSMPSQSVRSGAGLLTCTVGNWAVRDDGAGMTESSCLTTAATNRVDITNSASLTAGVIDDAFTRSAVPTLTDNLAIGDPNGTLWTHFFHAKVRNHAATAGTNNIGGTPGVLTSIHFRCLSWYSDTSPAATDWLHAEDASNSTLPCRVRAGGFAAVAIAIQNTTTAQTTGLDWHFNRNAGGYAAMSNTATSTAIAFAGVDAPSMADTASIDATVLTMPDSYIAGKVIAQAASQPVVAFTAGSTTNAIILVKTDASTAVGDTFCIQAAKSGGAVSTVTQSNFPCLLIVSPASGY